ncbi:MAG: nucleoside recognition domain-containing protein [Emergencia sp.]
MTDLIHFVLFGDFGLLTMTPRYLFLVLFPIMTLVGLIKEILSRLPIGDDIFTLLTGLGCTTAALAGLRSSGGECGKCRNSVRSDELPCECGKCRNPGMNRESPDECGKPNRGEKGLGKCRNPGMNREFPDGCGKPEPGGKALGENPGHSEKSLQARRSTLIWTLVLIIPCSSQIALIATFASMVTTRVFLSYVTLCLVFIAVIFAGILMLSSIALKQTISPTSYICFSEKYGKSGAKTDKKITKRLFGVVKESFLGVMDSAFSFCIGSIIISIAMYYGLVEILCYQLQPVVETYMGLPPETVTLLLFNVLKRDFGSATLMMVGGSGAFDAVQLMALLIMMTFTVPCFNSTVLLFKEEGPWRATFVWMTSLFISLLLGKLTMILLGWLFY